MENRVNYKSAIHLALLAVSLQVLLGYLSLPFYPPTKVGSTALIVIADFFFFALALCSTIWTARELVKNGDSIFKIFGNRRTIISIFIILSVGLFTYLYFQSKFFIDEDEYFQSSASIESTPFQASTSQHQPPVDYAITRAWTSIIGFNYASIRLPHAFISLVFLLVFYFLLLEWKIEWKIATVATVLVSFSYGFIRFSHESRPQILAFLTALLFLYYFFLSKTHTRVSIPLYFSCSYFLCSIGLQPIIFLFCFFVLYIVIYRPTTPTNFRSIWPVPIALIPALVSGYAVTLYSAKRLRTDGYSALGTIKILLHQPILQGLHVPGSPGLWLLLVILVVSGYTIRKNKKPQREFIVVTLLCISFPILFSSIFNTLITQKLNDRYFALIHVPLWISIAFAINLLTAINWKKRIPIVFCLFVGVGYSTSLALHSDLDILRRQDGSGIYAEISQRVQPDDWVISVVSHFYPFDDSLQYEYDLHSKGGKAPFLYLLSPIEMLTRLQRNQYPKRIFFLFLPYIENEAANERALALVPELKKVEVKSYNYLFYEYTGALEKQFSNEFIFALNSVVLAGFPNSRFNATALELANLILKKKPIFQSSAWNILLEERRLIPWKFAFNPIFDLKNLGN